MEILFEMVIKYGWKKRKCLETVFSPFLYFFLKVVESQNCVLIFSISLIYCQLLIFLILLKYSLHMSLVLQGIGIQTLDLWNNHLPILQIDHNEGFKIAAALQNLECSDANKLFAVARPLEAVQQVRTWPDQIIN